jgi:hypothetical protein
MRGYVLVIIVERRNVMRKAMLLSVFPVVVALRLCKLRTRTPQLTNFCPA